MSTNINIHGRRDEVHRIIATVSIADPITLEIGQRTTSYDIGMPDTGVVFFLSTMSNGEMQELAHSLMRAATTIFEYSAAALISEVPS